jgi:hypothetical protein
MVKYAAVKLNENVQIFFEENSTALSLIECIAKCNAAFAENAR